VQKSASHPAGISIPAPASRPQLMLVGKKGPALSSQCADCNGFDTVVIRRNGQTINVRCTCQLVVSA
jgi:hypothetical protein